MKLQVKSNCFQEPTATYGTPHLSFGKVMKALATSFFLSHLTIKNSQKEDPSKINYSICCNQAVS